MRNCSKIKEYIRNHNKMKECIRNCSEMKQCIGKKVGPTKKTMIFSYKNKCIYMNYLTLADFCARQNH